MGVYRVSKDGFSGYVVSVVCGECGHKQFVASFKSKKDAQRFVEQKNKEAKKRKR